MIPIFGSLGFYLDERFHRLLAGSFALSFYDRKGLERAGRSLRRLGKSF